MELEEEDSTSMDNNDTKEDSSYEEWEEGLYYVDMVLCQCIRLTITNNSSMMAEITAGSNKHCNLARPRKRGWTGSSSTPGGRRSCRRVLTGRRRLTSCMDVDTLCVEPNNIKSNLKPDRTER